MLSRTMSSIMAARNLWRIMHLYTQRCIQGEQDSYIGLLFKIQFVW